MPRAIIVKNCVINIVILLKKSKYIFIISLLRICLVDCNDDYIGIRIGIRRNTRYCNLLGDNTRIEP